MNSDRTISIIFEIESVCWCVKSFQIPPSSFWQQSFRAGTNIRLFEEEEASVIRDLMAVMSDIIDTESTTVQSFISPPIIYHVMCYLLCIKIAQLRHYASRVRIHRPALLNQ